LDPRYSGLLSARAIRLPRYTFRKIKQNLFWAFFYDTVAIPLMAFGFMHPVFAEMPLATSSISVVSNTNLLNLAPSVHMS